MTQQSKQSSKREVVVLALADLGADKMVVDTEDVAMRVYEMAPKSFSWRKYTEQVDLDSVRVSLTDACKPKYGSLAGGSVREGWHLTPAGVAWERANGAALRAVLETGGPATRPDARLETLHAASEATRVKLSDAFQDWAEGRKVPPRKAEIAFRVDAYTSRRERNLKLNRLAAIAEDLEDHELKRFVEEMTQIVLEAPGLDRTHDRRNT